MRIACQKHNIQAKRFGGMLHLTIQCEKYVINGELWDTQMVKQGERKIEKQNNIP